MVAPTLWTDKSLEEWNDASAVHMPGVHIMKIGAWELNALICEIQAWRRVSPQYEFISGPNIIRRKDYAPGAKNLI